ncbi:FadR/GntR family transcriptional regulator [Georgenia sp. AZ-5]|uniref:FadR/GntR family transcriptional regulator n=1 Tax=Georgenia sp. AZ-5 TaxID=3367526 RepID=UPI003755302B
MTTSASPTLAQQVMEALAREIVAGRRPPGAVLRIEDLQREHGVSRTVVRDALRAMESLHMVSARRSIGVTVQPTTEWNVFARDVVRWRLESEGVERQMRSLTSLRAAVEPMAASLSATAAPPSVSAELVALTDGMRAAAAAGDLDRFLELDLRFHSMILRSCGNEMFAALDEPIAEVLRARHEKNLMPSRPRDIPVLLHMLVAAAIRDGDPATAESAMRQIVAEVQSIVDRRRADG